jgi:hypothetical protein
MEALPANRPIDKANHFSAQVQVIGNQELRQFSGYGIISAVFYLPV